MLELPAESFKRAEDFEVKFFVDELSGDAYAFSHCEGGENCSDSKAVKMSKAEKRERSGYGKAGYVKGDFDFCVACFCDVRKFPRKQIGRRNRKKAAV